MAADGAADGAGEAGGSGQGRAILFGPFRLLPSEQLLLNGGQAVPLGARAFELLVALTSRPGEVVSKDELMARVWLGTFVEESNIRVHVAGLRRALRDGVDGQRYIVNVPGRGYSFVAPVRTVLPAAAGPEPVAAAHPSAVLPRSGATLFGRSEVVDALCAQLVERRFVTLVGPGGIGKTTVAIAVAHRVSGSYPDGVFFVDFSSIRDPGLVPATLAAALGLAVTSQAVMPAVLAHLGRKNLLLLLDNCEHVIETAANAAEDISSSAAGVHVLSTSREPLRAAGERVHRLSPLESPSKSAGLTAEEAQTFPCVQLFVERVAASLDDFRLSDADAPLAAEICRKLDGIALAVELAAGRVAAFGLQELAARLDDRFRLLTSGRRTALPRHQTLAATLDWSYELLPAAEQALLRRLSVFTGDFSLQAAIAVTVGADSAQVVASIGELVSKSLVAADWNAVGLRYRLLETTRVYGAEKLRARQELAETARAHAAYMLGVFQTAEPDSKAMSPQQWRAKYATQIDNLRAALDWAESPAGEPAIYVALAIAAVPLWVHLSLMAECRTRVERGLAMVIGEDRAAMEKRMRLSAAFGWSLMYAAGRSGEIGAAWATTLDLADALDDMHHRLRAIWGVWIGKLNRGEMDAALALASRVLELVEGSGEQTDLLMADRLMATTLHYRGDQTQARFHMDRMFGRYAAGPAEPSVASFHVDQQVTAGYFRARILWLQGYADQALGAAQRNIRDGESLGHALLFASVLGQAACPIALLTGNLSAARLYGTMLLEHAERHAIRLWIDWARSFIGLVAIKEGDLAAGLDMMQTAFDHAGENRFLPRYMLLHGEFAEAVGASGERRLGAATIDATLERCERSGERWYVPELMRIRGELLASGAGARLAEAKEQFVQAMDLARLQGARSWQLRAAISAGDLALRGGDVAEARGVLASVYEPFEEGHATQDLRKASRLLSLL